MDKLIDMAFELKTKLTDKEYLDLNNQIMEVYKTKAIIIKENDNSSKKLLTSIWVWKDKAKSRKQCDITEQCYTDHTRR